MKLIYFKRDACLVTFTNASTCEYAVLLCQQAIELLPHYCSKVWGQ